MNFPLPVPYMVYHNLYRGTKIIPRSLGHQTRFKLCAERTTSHQTRFKLCAERTTSHQTRFKLCVERTKTHQTRFEIREVIRVTN
jgi:hypothetical protein